MQMILVFKKCDFSHVLAQFAKWISAGDLLETIMMTDHFMSYNLKQSKTFPYTECQQTNPDRVITFITRKLTTTWLIDPPTSKTLSQMPREYYVRSVLSFPERDMDKHLEKGKEFFELATLQQRQTQQSHS